MKINKRQINIDTPCYIIAEISHNHQGKEANAYKIIRAAAKNGASAVKFQKRDNFSLFVPEFYNKSYRNKNSFGDTYGKHREFLEPKISWLKKSNQLAHELGMDFIITVFDVASLILCEKELNVDAYKIQSSDLTSHFLIKKVAATKKPYFISCGAASLNEIKKTFKLCKSLKTPFCLMYAVSEYPTTEQNVNLKRLNQLKKVLKTDQIGFSCHNTSIKPAIYSRILGAIAIEKHFTLNKKLKGPDHKLSIDSKELISLRQNLDNCDQYLGKPWVKRSFIEKYQLDARFKMGKCAVAAKTLKKGDILKESDIIYQSPMLGKNFIEIKNKIGKKLTSDINKGEVF